MHRSASWLALLMTLLAASCPNSARADLFLIYVDLPAFESALTSYDQFSHPRGGLQGGQLSYQALGAEGFGFSASALGGLFGAEGMGAQGNPNPVTTTILSAGDMSKSLNFGSFVGGGNAFGAYFYDTDSKGNAVPGAWALTVNGTSGSVTAPLSGVVPFIGLIDLNGPITSASVTATNGLSSSVDQVVVGYAPVVGASTNDSDSPADQMADGFAMIAVPEPGALGLMLPAIVAIAGVVFRARRHRRPRYSAAGQRL